MNHLLFHMLIVAAGVLAAAEGPPAKVPDPGQATWHLGMSGFLGVTPKGVSRNLDIYATFADGRVVNCLGTAPTYNKSIHLPERCDIAVAPNRTVAGSVRIQMTPDPWIPADHQAFSVDFTISGTLDAADRLSGSWSAQRVGDGPLGDHPGSATGALVGGASATETGWGDASWTMGMNQITPVGGIDTDVIVLSFGVASGAVRWAGLGLTANPAWPAWRIAPVPVDGLTVSGQGSLVQGSIIVSGRNLHPGGDPAARFRLDVDARRVQGLSGGRARITPLDAAGKPAGESWSAAGRGTCRKGDGETDPTGAALWRRSLDQRPWWVPVAGHVPVQPDEHPRLLFRKSDLPALRQRAATATGAALIGRLREVLGKNGEAIPDQFNPTPPNNGNPSPNLPLGTFTTWHAAGFGFLHQITGEATYAELSRQCVQLMLDGKGDIDARYGWSMPGLDMRCGSVLAAMAYAYDFCHDAWPDEFRRKIALEIQDFKKSTAGGGARKTDIPELAGRTGYPPGSNHYGSLIGGAAVALLAVRGDAGTDLAFVDRHLEEIRSNVPRMLELGFGDAGMYAEGIPPSRLSSNGGLLEMFLAERHAAGRDWVDGPRPNAAWITLRWITHLGDTFAMYPNRGIYGNDSMYAREGMLSHEGDFAVGFATIPEKYRGALLWSWKTYVEAGELTEWDPKNRPKFNCIRYPHRAFLAFLSWPVDEAPTDPATVIPRCTVDRVHGCIVARERWRDAQDIIVTQALEIGPKGYYQLKDGKRSSDRAGTFRIWGRGLQTLLTTNLAGALPVAFARADNGSYAMTVLKNSKRSAFAVDFSGRSGALAVVLAVGPDAVSAKVADPPAAKGTVSTAVQVLALADSSPVNLVTLQEGAAPPVTVNGQKISVGGQIFAWDGNQLSFDGFTPVPE
ncbi:hypothetical protein LBMAG53_09180 [Planctomycetota bacterium]|nr:hypothetical protein LBMAG53_09180 [Planctomycetota bacterium]